MRYLGIALFAEGSTDDRFLNPLLARLCEDLCLRRGEGPIEVAPLVLLHAPSRFRNASHEVQVLESVRNMQCQIDILFLHTDGGGDAARAIEERIDPVRRIIQERLTSFGGRAIAVVPVRETEAWALADGDAIRTAFGSNRDDSSLGIPARIAEVESLPDPKRSLNDAWRAAWPNRRRRNQSATGCLDLLGQHARLDRLRLVPAFARLHDDLLGALRQLRFLTQGE